MGEKEEMTVRDAWQVVLSCFIAKNPSRLWLILSCTGEKRHRSGKAQERPGGSNIDSRGVRRQDGHEIRWQFYFRRRWWVALLHRFPTIVDGIRSL